MEMRQVQEIRGIFADHIPSAVKQAVSLLENAGFEAFLVGGCVRDLLLNKQPHDFDLTTSALPDQICAVFQAYPQQAQFKQHGTVQVLIDQTKIEITTYRVESEYVDYRRPQSITFSKNLAEDLSRRDFTINALAYHPKHGLIDLFAGAADLHAGIIRTVGFPAERLNEDALRILRALRFQASLNFTIESDTANAMLAHRHLLHQISAERITQELKQIILTPHADRVFRENPLILAVPIPELASMIGFKQFNPHHQYDVYEHSIRVMRHTPPTVTLRLAGLLHDCAKPECFSFDERGIGHFYGHAKLSADLAGNILRRLKFDRRTLTRVRTLIQFHELPLRPNEHLLKKRIHRLGGETLLELTDLQIADNLSKTAAERERITDLRLVKQAIADILAKQPCLSLRELAINGHDVMRVGLHGRAIGIMLNRILELVLADQLPNERQTLLSYLAEQIKQETR